MSPLHIKEHTAQLGRAEQQKYQELFINKDINALSCSTTFEMGVDVGDLETVTRVLRMSMQMVAAAAALAVMIAVPSRSYGSVIKTGSEETVQTRDSAEGLPFEEAIENFYQTSGSITDDQILDSARNILSNGDVRTTDGAAFEAAK